MSASPKCATCRWFQVSRYDGPTDENYDQTEPGRWGQCRYVLDSDPAWTDDGQQERPHSTRAYPADASGYSAWLVVRDDFGCVEHSAADGV